MKEQIQQLIAEGRVEEALALLAQSLATPLDVISHDEKIEEALALLAQSSVEAIQLHASYIQAKKHYNMGTIEFREWQRVQNKISHAALNLVNSIKEDEKSHKTNKSSENGSQAPEVFLTYNARDKKIADAIREYLREHGILDVVDYTEVDAGESIKDFTRSKFEKTDFVLALISANSLRGGWAGLEKYLDVFSNGLVTKNFIPLVLDHSFTESDFIRNELEKMDEKIDNIEEDVQMRRLPEQKAKELEAELTVLRNNLPRIVQRLRNVSVADISGENFKKGMNKVLKSILNSDSIPQSAT